MVAFGELVRGRLHHEDGFLAALLVLQGGGGIDAVAAAGQSASPTAAGRVLAAAYVVSSFASALCAVPAAVSAVLSVGGAARRVTGLIRASEALDELAPDGDDGDDDDEEGGGGHDGTGGPAGAATDPPALLRCEGMAVSAPGGNRPTAPFHPHGRSPDLQKTNMPTPNPNMMLKASCLNFTWILKNQKIYTLMLEETLPHVPLVMVL